LAKFVSDIATIAKAFASPAYLGFLGWYNTNSIHQFCFLSSKSWDIFANKKRGSTERFLLPITLNIACAHHDWY